jgi:hypothetical protein
MLAVALTSQRSQALTTASRDVARPGPARAPAPGMAAQVASFAEGYYYKLRDTTPDTQESLNIKYVFSHKAVNWFLDWLERQL